MTPQYPPAEAMYFRPTQDFEGEVNGVKNSYLTGLTYTIRPGNHLLLFKAKYWRHCGLIEFVDQPLARVSATGRVL